MRSSIATKSAPYVAWILLWQRWKLGEEMYYNFRHRIFPTGLLFWRALYSLQQQNCTQLLRKQQNVSPKHSDCRYL